MKRYGERVDALLGRLGTDLTERDFASLALACADQAGVSIASQARIAALLPASPRALEIADMPREERSNLVTALEWRGWRWWLHDRSGECPRGGEDGAEAARIVLARDELERQSQASGT